MDMKFFLRMLIVSTVLCGVSCSSNESKGNAEEQATDPQSAETEVAAPAEVKPANAAFIVISKESKAYCSADNEAYYHNKHKLGQSFPICPLNFIFIHYLLPPVNKKLPPPRRRTLLQSLRQG